MQLEKYGVGFLLLPQGVNIVLCCLELRAKQYKIKWENRRILVFPAVKAEKQTARREVSTAPFFL